MTRFRSVSLWGIVLGWAAAHSCVTTQAGDAPQPPAIPTTSAAGELSEPAPPPSSTGIPTGIPATPVVPAGSLQPVPDQSYSPNGQVIQGQVVQGQIVDGQIISPITVVESTIVPPPGAEIAPTPPVKPQQLVPQPARPAAGQPQATTEVVRERYPNKQIAIERTVTQDEKHNYVNHGTWTMWDPSGRLICQGDFLNGKAVGKWIRVFPEGGEDPYSGPEYDDFARPFKAETTYSDDKIVGEWTLTDAQGRTMHSWQFNDDRLNGKAVAYFANGKVKTEAVFLNGVLDGEAVEYDAQGNKISATAWLAGRRFGPTTQRYPSGAKYSEGEYIYAREDREAKYDFFKGTIRADKIDDKKPDVRNGHWTWWYEDGEKMCEGDFNDGKAVGRHVWYYPSGQKEMEGEFIDGKRQGVWVTWHQNGLKKSEGVYDTGREAGEWYTWKDDGKVQTAVTHRPPRNVPTPDGTMIANPSGQQRQQQYRPQVNRRPKTLADSINRTFR